MLHIRQKSTATGKSLHSNYTVVITDKWKAKDLHKHPAVVEHPQIFEVVDEEIPDHAQYINW